MGAVRSRLDVHTLLGAHDRAAIRPLIGAPLAYTPGTNGPVTATR